MNRNRTGHPRWLGWGIGGTTAVVLLLTGYSAFFSGDGDDPSRTSDRPAATATDTGPDQTYDAPSDWTEPQRWAALPRGARTDRFGNEVGFPHTTEGAVAMLVASNSTEVKYGHSHVQEQLTAYESYLISADRTAENRELIELEAVRLDSQMRRSMGLPPGSDLPAGAYARNFIVGFQVIHTSATEADAWLLSRVTDKSGEMEEERETYTRSLASAEWDGNDWRLSAASTENGIRRHANGSRPPFAAPGDAAFNSGGWTAIRAAS